jgi:RNA methyltransferase, TrmH family
VITSLKNSHIVRVRKLAQRKHRQEQDAFLVEGLQLIGLALDGGAGPREAFYCEAQFRGPGAPILLDRLARAGTELNAVSRTVMDSLTDRKMSQGLVATFALFETPLAALDLSGQPEPPLVVVLDRLQDPGNLGTLIRTADAVGARAVILLEPCVDPFDPKTVRGTMGSLFSVPLARTREPAACFQLLAARGLTVVGADSTRGRLPWEPGAWPGPAALVLGNEARGLGPDVRPHVDRWLRLPVVGRAESLNVAVAGGTLMYFWLRATMEKV